MFDKKLLFWSTGGCGDQILSFRLTKLLKDLYPSIDIWNNCCVRDETWNMISTIYENNDINKNQFNINKYPEDWLRDIKSMDCEEIKSCDENAESYLIWPDKLFRGLGAPPLKEWNITNFLVKQTRTLLGKWKPNGYISLALNSITPGYTYHSVVELAYKLAQEFPDKKIYLPLLINWNGKDVQKFNFPHPPENLIIEIQPDFNNVFSILCQSDYLVTTDNAMMHIAHDLGMPYLTLDPQFDRLAFKVRWRTYGNYHSIPISALVEDIINVIKVQIEIPETQMISATSIFRNEVNWSEELIFKN